MKGLQQWEDERSSAVEGCKVFSSGRFEVAWTGKSCLVCRAGRCQQQFAAAKHTRTSMLQMQQFRADFSFPLFAFARHESYNAKWLYVK
jgi:hypothetical protein